MKILFVSAILMVICLANISHSKDAALETVSVHGQLSVKGTDLVDKNGNKVQLKGMSLFWDVWQSQYYDKTSIQGIHKLCHSNVVRAAMAANKEYGGYIESPEATLKRLYTVIDAAIENDIYVIVDWHDHEAQNHTDYAIKFFDTVSKKYSGKPNILYETFNEPKGVWWNDAIKPYHEVVIKTIRANDNNNVIILGTPFYSNYIKDAAANPIKDQKNIMYTLHFYAGTNKQPLRNNATEALNSGLPLFVTEYGTVNSNATDPVDSSESKLWWKWLDEHNISYVNWAISDKEEGASALLPDTPASQACQEKYLTESGKLVVAQNKA